MEWISVKDRLPSVYGLYITFTCNHKFVNRFGGVEIMRYYPKKKIFWWFDRVDGAEVTHWMKIPEVKGLNYPPLQD